jgi:sec-independent protein translocase protein TatA
MPHSPQFFAVFGLGPTELIVILVILLVLFGGSKLPSLAKGLGQSVKEFKKAQKEAEAEDESSKSAATPAATVTSTEPKKIEPAKPHGTA